MTSLSEKTGKKWLIPMPNGNNDHKAGGFMTVTRTINGKPVSDEDIKEHVITNKHVINVLYNARRRAVKESGR